MASNCSEWRVLNKLVCLGKDECHFFSLMCGQNSEEKAPEPVSFHTPCPCPPQRSTITTCKSWGRVPNSPRPCRKGRAQPKQPQWARWWVGLRSHPAPPTPGFGVKDLYMTPLGQPRAAKGKQASPVSGNSCITLPDVALNTCLGCQQGEGTSPPGRQLENERAERCVVWVRLHCSRLPAPRPGLSLARTNRPLETLGLTSTIWTKPASSAVD